MHDFSSQPPTPDWVEPRGVYRSAHLEHGKRYLYAVDSHGEVVARHHLAPGQCEEVATAHLWQYLNTLDEMDIDPDVGPPKLTLIRTA